MCMTIFSKNPDGIRKLIDFLIFWLFDQYFRLQKNGAGLSIVQ